MNKRTNINHFPAKTVETVFPAKTRKARRDAETLKTSVLTDTIGAGRTQSLAKARKTRRDAETLKASVLIETIGADKARRDAGTPKVSVLTETIGADKTLSPVKVAGTPTATAFTAEKCLFSARKKAKALCAAKKEGAEDTGETSIINPPKARSDATTRSFWLAVFSFPARRQSFMGAVGSAVRSVVNAVSGIIQSAVSAVSGTIQRAVRCAVVDVFRSAAKSGVWSPAEMVVRRAAGGNNIKDRNPGIPRRSENALCFAPFGEGKPGGTTPQGFESCENEPHHIGAPRLPNAGVPRHIGAPRRFGALLRRGGFTILELTIAMALIAVLTATAVSVVVATSKTAGFAENTFGSITELRAAKQEIIRWLSSFDAADSKIFINPDGTSVTAVRGGGEEKLTFAQNTLFVPGGPSEQTGEDGVSKKTFTLLSSASFALARRDAETGPGGEAGAGAGPRPGGLVSCTIRYGGNLFFTFVYCLRAAECAVESTGEPEPEPEPEHESSLQSAPAPG